MKKIYESPLNGHDDGERAERVHVYEIENEQEFWAFDSMSYEEKCAYFNVRTWYGAMPGQTYYTYEFDHTCHHVIMYECIAVNV